MDFIQIKTKIDTLTTGTLGVLGAEGAQNLDVNDVVGTIVQVIIGVATLIGVLKGNKKKPATRKRKAGTLVSNLTNN